MKVPFLTALLLCAAVYDVTSKSSPTSPPTSQGKVLFIGTVGSKSHKNFYNGIIDSLANANYQVTVLTPYKRSSSHPNIREVVFPENDINQHMANAFGGNAVDPIIHISTEGPKMCRDALGSPQCAHVLQENFDLVYVSMFFNECFLGHVNKWNVPFVFVNPAMMLGPFSGGRIGNPTFPSFEDNPILSLPKTRNFWHRTIAAVASTALWGFVSYTEYRMDKDTRGAGLLPPNTPYLPTIYNNASLMIANSLRYVEDPRPYMPNILLAGGIHLKPSQPLPKELEDWATSAGDAGFIFFSLGSAVRTSDMPLSTVKIFLKAFAGLRQKVLWKFELADVGTQLPDNVRITPWAPQQDLLGHRQMKLFITHGGLHSTQEATYHGVPVVGIPIFGDQEGNMKTAVEQGWGVSLRWQEVTVDSLTNAITSMLDNKQAKEKVKTLAGLMQDTPSKPADDIVWWAGYLIRTGGARHLRSGALQFYWYQLYNLDVWLLISAVVLLVLYCQWRIVTACCRKICCAKKSSKQSKKFKKN